MKNLFLILFSISIISLNSVFANESLEKLVNQSFELYNSNPAESFSICLEAEKLANKTNEHTFDGDISFIKGRYFLLTTKYDLSTTELNKAIEIYKLDNNKSSLSATYSLKSLLLSRIGEDEKAHNLLLEVINLDRELKDTSSLISHLSNITYDYLIINDLDSMKFTLDEIKTYEPSFYPVDYYYFYQNIGSYYIASKEPELALENLHKAKNLAIELDMTDSRATILTFISQAYRLAQNYDKAAQFSLESYEFSKQNDLIYETSEALAELILVKEVQNKFNDAYTLQKEWMEIEKEIFNLEKIQKIKVIEGALVLAEKEKIITEGEIALQTEKLEGEKTKSKNMWLFGAIIIVLILMSFTIFIYLKTKRLNVTINSQKKEVEIKSSSLELALKSINDSIEYSKRIQNAILPPLRAVKEHLKDSFILYKPKDIVAGDFYWMENRNGKVLFAAADCTGHGVPGAMVSVVCNNALNRSVREHALTDPADILEKTRQIVIDEFEKSDDEVKDGMDIALCALNGNTLQYAGANNPLWIIRNGELIEIKGDKQPIGKFIKPKPFTAHAIELEKNDSIYIFSDGYSDQFGGENGKKFKVKAFKKLLIEIQNKSMDKQKQFIDDHFESWKGDLEQLDDVCVIGVKI
jgi:serine phosphatase RsbU (regulator of sigma subunit)